MFKLIGPDALINCPFDVNDEGLPLKEAERSIVWKSFLNCISLLSLISCRLEHSSCSTIRKTT